MSRNGIASELQKLQQKHFLLKGKIASLKANIRSLYKDSYMIDGQEFYEISRILERAEIRREKQYQTKKEELAKKKGKQP